VVKNLGITQLRRSPFKIQEVRLNLQVVGSFLSQKKGKWCSFTQKFLYCKAQGSEQFKFHKDEILNMTTDELTNETGLGFDKSNVWTSTQGSLGGVATVAVGNRQAEHSEEVEN
jgi:hypothetical protein